MFVHEEVSSLDDDHEYHLPLWGPVPLLSWGMNQLVTLCSGSYYTMGSFTEQIRSIWAIWFKHMVPGIEQTKLPEWMHEAVKSYNRVETLQKRSV